MANLAPPPPTPNPSHEQCPDADAAGELQALLDHLGRYDEPGKLAVHLRTSHRFRVHSSDETDLGALHPMHQAAHAPDVTEASRRLVEVER